MAHGLLNLPRIRARVPLCAVGRRLELGDQEMTGFRDLRTARCLCACLAIAAYFLVACGKNEQRQYTASAPDSGAIIGPHSPTASAAISRTSTAATRANAGNENDVATGGADGGAQSVAGGKSEGTAGSLARDSNGSNSHDDDSGVALDAGIAADSGANPASCPPSFAHLMAATSCSTNVACAYPEGYCTCVGRCSGIAPAPDEQPPASWWSCSRPSEGCPIGVPDEGAACSGEGRTCVYGACCVQLVSCRSNRWTAGRAMCPP